MTYSLLGLGRVRSTLHHQIYLARRHVLNTDLGFYRASSALALCMVVCLSVRLCVWLSVRHKSVFY